MAQLPYISDEGLTVLAERPEATIDIAIIHGLNGNPKKTWTHRTGFYWPWELSKSIPNARVMLFGYDTAISSEGRKNFVRIRGLAESLLQGLRTQRVTDAETKRPLLFIAHSLGGLVVKRAIILAQRNERGRIYDCTLGVMFYGTPNAGSTLDQQKRVQILQLIASVAFVEVPPKIKDALESHSDELVDLADEFAASDICTSYRLLIYIFYETKVQSPLRERVVDEFSARTGIPKEEVTAIQADHSQMVKFSEANDSNFQNLLGIVRHLQKVSGSRSEDILTGIEKACLRSLSFQEMHARNSNIEPSETDTGDWLLRHSDFQDWTQRNRLSEHHGFFWIRGNPGSGKSTLMKKAYSYMSEHSKDPLCVIGAFFFNARGSPEEKSLTGLFRTLLHTLCRQMSTFRALVVDKYIEKCEILHPSWQWQLSELKTLLDFVITKPVIKHNRLILFIDALDECGFSGAKEVIEYFEQLVSSAISQGTNLNICLSSRHWSPQWD